jgi:8-oxo-dGTP pyrophosphatase MutT (NUDIX family)
MVREVEEETGLKVLEAKEVFRRIDVKGCHVISYLVYRYEGVPEQREAGKVTWQSRRNFLKKCCTFRTYNRKLFEERAWSTT